MRANQIKTGETYACKSGTRYYSASHRLTVLGTMSPSDFFASPMERKDDHSFLERKTPFGNVAANCLRQGNGKATIVIGTDERGHLYAYSADLVVRTADEQDQAEEQRREAFAAAEKERKEREARRDNIMENLRVLGLAPENSQYVPTKVSLTLEDWEKLLTRVRF